MNPRARHRLLAILATAALLTACAAASTDAPAAPISVTPSPSASAAAHDSQPIDISKLSGRIVFSNATDDVWSVNASGTDLRQLTRDPAHDFDPTLSPDGKLIAFRSERDGNNEVYVMNADGSSQRNVSRHETDDWGPTWSPDGNVLWNCARNMAVGFHPCVANPNGTGLHIIPLETYFEYGAWSPDGSKIAFMAPGEAGFSGIDPNYEVFVMNADGSRLKQLTNGPGQDGFPAWSPDGTQIAFSSTRDDCSNSDASDCRSSGDIGPYHTLYVMNADGSHQRRLSLQFAQFMDWSPGGQFLVFSPGLNVIRPDGTDLVQIPAAVGGDIEFADWGTMPQSPH